MPLARPPVQASHAIAFQYVPQNDGGTFVPASSLLPSFDALDGGHDDRNLKGNKTMIEIYDGIRGGGASVDMARRRAREVAGGALRCQKVCWPTSQAENSCQARFFVGNEGCARKRHTCVGEAATPCRCIASTSENCVPHSTCARMNRALQSRAPRLAHAAGGREVRRWSRTVLTKPVSSSGGAKPL